MAHAAAWDMEEKNRALWSDSVVRVEIQLGPEIRDIAHHALS